jgi:Cu/Zn superoxide dismutase
MKFCATAVACVALLGSIGGCQSVEESTKGAFGPKANIAARLRPLGSAINAQVSVGERADGVTVAVSVQNGFGGNYRLTFNQIGNCNSPNGFSAGPIWIPPGVTKTPDQLYPVMLLNQEAGQANASFFVPGAQIDGPNGVLGRTVVLYYGLTLFEAEPGVPNNRVACGVLIHGTPFMFQ